MHKKFIYFIIILILVFGLIGLGITYHNLLNKNNALVSELNDNKIILTQVQDELVSVQESLNVETKKSIKLDSSLRSANLELKDVKKELETANIIIEDFKDEEYNFIYIGDYTTTHYCCERYAHVCGLGHGLTATGTEVTAGRSVAVDPSVIPYGTTMYIEGYGLRIAEDCGGGVDGKHIDIAVDTHANAIKMGTGIKSVWVLVKK